MSSVMDVPETVTEEMILALVQKKKALQRKLEESALVAAGATFTRESILITNQSLPDHPIVFANPSFTAVTQYTQEDILGRNCRFLQGPDTDRSQVDAMRTAIKARQPLEVELLNYRKDKTQFYNRLRLEPFTSQDGTPYYVSVQSDVSAQRERVRKLELLSLALDAAEEAILITDMNLPDNPIIYASAGFTRMTGYTREDIYGRNCRFLQGVDTDRTTVAKIRSAIAASLPLAVEILNYKKDGRAFWNQFNLTPVFDESGKATHYVAVQYEHSTIIDERSFLRGLLSRCCNSNELSL